MSTIVISIIFGSIIGFALGLTGGGGAIFAVPLLVYGLGVAPREAVGISLASVGSMAAVGLVSRWRKGQVELKTGLIFAVAGMLGTPIGSWLSTQIPEWMLLMLFAVLMLVVATRMWLAASVPEHTTRTPDLEEGGPACRRDLAGNLFLTSRCSALLLGIGMATGVLAGLFGVGGGFVIVPALVLFSSMTIHRAVGTSLLVITLVSIAGVGSYLAVGRTIPTTMTIMFVVGGIAGMSLGILASGRLSGRSLQRAFAATIVAVAIFVILRSLNLTTV